MVAVHPSLNPLPGENWDFLHSSLGNGFLVFPSCEGLGVGPFQIPGQSGRGELLRHTEVLLKKFLLNKITIYDIFS